MVLNINCTISSPLYWLEPTAFPAEVYLSLGENGIVYFTVQFVGADSVFSEGFPVPRGSRTIFYTGRNRVRHFRLERDGFLYDFTLIFNTSIGNMMFGEELNAYTVINRLDSHSQGIPDESCRGL